MAAEPVRGGRAAACIVGDTEAIALARRNPDWAATVEPKNSLDKRPNTWMVRYGDVPWRQFLDTWCGYVVASGEVQRLYDKYAAEIL
jgi:polar amino acid transport system substrate-binding protein